MLNCNRWVKSAVLSAIVCIVPIKSIAASFLETEQPIMEIKDEHRRAEAWGTCAAAYDLMSLMQAEASPAYSKQMADKSNGAVLALYMDYFMGMPSEADSSQISARVKMAKVLSESIPETQLTAMMAAGEQSQYSEEWINSISRTLELCLSNLDEQQQLIDLWRTMYASGMFE